MKRHLTDAQRKDLELFESLSPSVRARLLSKAKGIIKSAKPAEKHIQKVGDDQNPLDRQAPI